MSFINALQKKYKCGYVFFHQLFPNALELLQKSLLVLDKAIDKGDGNEWRQTIKAIKSISEDMCFKRLKKLKVLELNNNQLTDISALAKLKQLKEQEQLQQRKQEQQPNQSANKLELC